MDAMIYPKVHIPDFVLKVYDKNFEYTGKIDECVLYPEKFCKVSHLQFNNGQSERICGWDAVFKDKNKNQLVKTDENTGDMNKYAFHACPNDIGHQVKIVWSNFIKVVRNK